MKKYDFSDITFLTFVRLDNQERVDNLRAMMAYYRQNCDNYTHIIIEDDSEPRAGNKIILTKDDVLVYTFSDTEWNKSEGFNKGIKLAKTNILNLIDTDIIIHPKHLLETANILKSDSSAALIYPYNGLFLCAEKELKDVFCNSLNYDDLIDRVPSEFTDYAGSKDRDMSTLTHLLNVDRDGVTVGHYASKGGCVMARRDNLIRCNGYNPNFIGWGYEDDEMPTRANKLGFGVGRIEGVGKTAWHLHHFDGTGSAKEKQPFYTHNHQVNQFVESSNKEQLQEYIKTWIL